MTGIRLPRPPAPIALLILTALLTSPTLTAQQARIDREIEFVRGLAREMRFIALAQQEVGRLQQQYRSAADQDRIAQLNVEISLLGAKLVADRATQRQRYKEALDQSKELLDRSSDQRVIREARMTLADAAAEFGEFLIEELEIARNESPERVKELEEEAANVFKAGVEACEKVMSDLEGSKDSQRRLQHGLMWLRKGVLLREHARAVKSERGYLIPRSRSTLEDLALEVGEETALGLRALFEIAMCNEVAGKFAEAIDVFQGTISQIETSLKTADELGLNADTQAFLFQMMQEVYEHLSRVLFQQGRTAEAQKLFTQFRAHLKEFGEKGQAPLDVADPRFGHMVFLTEARFLAETGESAKVADALKMAQEINDRHPADIVGVRAKAVLRDILAAQKSLVSGRLLFEIAKGEQQNKNHEAAVIGLRRALAAMTPEEQAQLGLEAYDMMGRSFFLTDRFLESALAFREGLQRFGRQAQGTAAEETCDRLDQVMQRLKATTKNDPFFEPLATEATALITELGGSSTGNKLNWKLALQAMNANNFQEAASKFALVNRDQQFLYYELARVRVATARQMAGDLAGARQALADYRAWLEKPEAAIEARRTDLLQVRAQAVAELNFREASIAYLEAVGNPQTGARKDLTKYPAAIEQLRAFISNHAKDGESYVPYAWDYVGRLYTELGELAKAEEAYIALRDKNPSLASKLCTVVFDAYLQQIDNLAKERDKAIAENRDQAAIDPIRGELRQARQKLVALGQQYIRTSPEPQYALYSHTARQLQELEDWVKVEEIAAMAIDKFGNDATYKENVDRVLRPMIGDALLHQRKFKQAHDMLVEAEKVNPNLWELKRLLALTLGGWFEFDRSGRPVIVPGLDRPDEAYQKFWVEYQPWALRPGVEKFSLEWYTFHWEAYWFARRAAEISKDKSDFKNRAQSLYGIARSIDNFESLKKHGEAGLRLFNYFQLNRPN